MKNEISFCKPKGEFGFLSNFFPIEIWYGGKTWKSLEHIYQASKFEDNFLIEQIRNQEEPSDAAKTGRSNIDRYIKDWNKIKVGIMHKLILIKFLQHSDLRQKLIKTGDVQLIENNPNDYFWGIGHDGSGDNMLGKIIMSARNYFVKHGI